LGDQSLRLEGFSVERSPALGHV